MKKDYLVSIISRDLSACEHSGRMPLLLKSFCNKHNKPRHCKLVALCKEYAALGVIYNV